MNSASASRSVGSRKHLVRTPPTCWISRARARVRVVFPLCIIRCGSNARREKTLRDSALSDDDVTDQLENVVRGEVVVRPDVYSVRQTDLLALRGDEKRG